MKEVKEVKGVKGVKEVKGVKGVKEVKILYNSQSSKQLFYESSLMVKKKNKNNVLVKFLQKQFVPKIF